MSDWRYENLETNSHWHLNRRSASRHRPQRAFCRDSVELAGTTTGAANLAAKHERESFRLEHSSAPVAGHRAPAAFGKRVVGSPTGIFAGRINRQT